MKARFLLLPRPEYLVGVLFAVAVLSKLPGAHAQYTEVESNNDKTSANVLNFGTATSATISGTSANNTNAEADYFRVNTTYTTPGIYVNQLQFGNTSTNIGSIRALTQTTGTVNTGTDVIFQSTFTTGTATPYGFNQYYSFGGAGKTQSVYYKVVGNSSTTGGPYTATFSSSRVTPTNIGSFRPGRLTLAGIATAGSSGQPTDTSVVVFDANFNVYYDKVSGSNTFGYAASNNNPASGVSTFSLNRAFAAGTYYIAIGINNVATNQASAPDEAVRGNSVLDFPNVIATSNSFYNGNNGNTRPSNFTVTDDAGNTYTSSGQMIPSLYALNFYTFTVAAVPEPGTTAALVAGALGLAAARRRSRA